MTTTFTSQAASADTMINGFSGTEDTNYGTDTAVSGIGEQNNDVGVYKRFLIKFDLSSIPASANITSATLSLWIQADYSSNARDYKVYRILRNWVEAEATWNSWKSGSAWTTAGAGSNGNDVDLGTAWATTNFSATESVGTEKTFALNTTEFKKLINGTYTNYGWLIKSDGEADDAYLIYTAEEAVETTKRPKLVVEYVVPLYPYSEIF